tara:strand:+ start:1129 stop:2820 length:1692 start_codon:yes stop_codon:yes gene_type:complete
MATTQNNPYPYKDIPYNQGFWARVRLSPDITPEQLHELHLKHGHRTQSENLSMSNLEGLGESLPNPRYDLSMTPLTQDKPEMSISSIPEKTRANDLRYGPTGVNPETGMPDGVTMSGLPFQIDESSTVQTQQSPEGSYVPITGADLGLPMGPGVPVPAGVEMGDPFQIVQSGGTPDWITNAQNPSPVNLPPYSNPMLSGQAYAGLISGGQAVPSMIAPGVSYSMNSPMGYTAPGASAVPFPSYQPPEGVVVNNPNVNNPYPDYVDPYSIENRYADELVNQQEMQQLAQLANYDYENVNLFALLDRIQNPLEDLSSEEILSLNNPAPVVDTRPPTVSPLGSLDTTYLNDIDFGGLINTPNPQVDFPIAPPAVIDSAIENLPVYQDPIVSMVDPIGNPVTPFEIDPPVEFIDTPPVEPVYIPPTEPIGTLPTQPVVNLVPETYVDPIMTLPQVVEPTPLIDTLATVNNDFANLGFDNRIGQPLEVTVPLPYSEPVATPAVSYADLVKQAQNDESLPPYVRANPSIAYPGNPVTEAYKVQSLLNSPVGSGFSPGVAATPSYGLLDR